jgi:hypothetical protein
LMARWRIYRQPDGHLGLDYLNPGAWGVFRCGVLHQWTSTDLILKWIVEQDATTTGDLVILPDGGALQILPQSPWRV